MLRRFSFSNFRMIGQLSTSLEDNLTLLYGGNAQGKTSILEALFYCAAFASPLTAQDMRLIRFSALNEPLTVGRIKIEFDKDQEKQHLEVRLIQENGLFRREILHNGLRLGAQKAIGLFTAVLFLPQMTAILESTPDERRRYMNIMLSQAIPGYAVCLSEYKKIIAQRNALLRQIRENNASVSQIIYWDEMAASRAAILMKNRYDAILDIDAIGKLIHTEFTFGKEKFEIHYKPSIRSDSFTSDALQAEIYQVFSLNHSRDIAAGLTTSGPHRDDFFVFANSIDLNQYGSRGQIRTAVLTLKTAEAEWLHRKTGYLPLLLLDETLAELDESRRTQVLKWLEQRGQSILTTTDISHFDRNFLERHPLWTIENGCLTH